MKNIFALLFLAFSIFTNAQTEQTHIPASKSIVGIWRQTTWVNNNGETTDRLTGNYKVINADGTYFTFVTWSNETTIGQYGTYEIKTDSTLVESVIKHSMNPNLNGTSGTLMYELKDEKTLMMAWKNNMGNWVNEKWARLRSPR